MRQKYNASRPQIRFLLFLEHNILCSRIFSSILSYPILSYSIPAHIIISNHNIFFSVDEIPASATMKSLEASKAVASAVKAKATQSKAITGGQC